MRSSGPATGDPDIHHKEIKLAQVSLVIVAGKFNWWTTTYPRTETETEINVFFV